MVDHHVDRPGVEASQDVQLTGTNSSIDLIFPLIPPPLAGEGRVKMSNDTLHPKRK